MGLAPQLLVLLFFLLEAVSALLADTGDAAPASRTLGSRQEDGHLHRLNGSGLRLTLHHAYGPRSPLSPPEPATGEIFRRDVLRAEALAARLSASGKEETAASSTSGSPGFGSVPQPGRASSLRTPLSPGVSLGVGNYVAEIGLGTPSKSYLMVVDTGSSLTWLQCRPCRVSCHRQVGAVFDPADSGTYRAVSCSSPVCRSLQSATLNPSACSYKSHACIYEASYGDSSFSAGYLSTETLSVGSSAVAGFVFGCGEDNEGLFGETAGLIGLARSKLSMLSQLAPKYGAAFSYCLPSRKSSSGYLSIGSGGGGKFSYTPMVTGSVDSTLYFLTFVGMSVGLKPLPVPASAYRGLPAIIDSGTVITRLPPAVYAALSEAISAALSEHPRAPAYSILDTCFNGSARSLPVPEVRMAFAGGAELRLSPRNVFYDVTKSRTCLAFARAGGVAIVGNRQQQTFKVFYDIAGSKIGFAAGGCR